LLLISLASTSGWAQGTAQITGSVKDATGAVLPGVDITATQTATGTARTTVTDETGAYTFTALPIGPYRLEAGLPGFRTYVQTGINLEVNASPALNIVLEVGQVSEQVEVQANAALVETRTVGVGQIMEQERILELPLNGRNVTELITLGGAAVQTGTSDSRSMPGQQAIRVAGGQAGSVAYSLDGATHNNPSQFKSAFAFSRRLAGVQSRNQRAVCLSGTALRRSGECCYAIWNERISRGAFRVRT